MSLHDEIAESVLREREASMCTGCHGHGQIPDGDGDCERWFTCEYCGGSGYLKAVA